MISPDGEEIPEGTSLFFNVINGAFSFGLVPNIGSTPNGTSYSCKYQVTMQWFFETWIIPEFPNPCRLSDVRALTAPTPGIMVPIVQVLPPSTVVPGQFLQWNGTQWIGSGGTVGPNLQVALVAGMNINAFQAISIHSDGKAYLASSGASSDAGKVVGVSITSATAGNTFTACLSGEVDNGGFIFAPGDQIFLGLSGALVNTPGNGVFEQPMGIAASSSRLMLEVGLPIVFA
jgi:hypothetical protein